MSIVRTFENQTPPPRYDGLPFTFANIREAATEGGAYTTIETVALSPLDLNPATPQARNFTTADATLTSGWYVVQWEDAAGSTADSDPVKYGVGPTPEGNLITLDEYKTAESITSSQFDEQIEQIIPQISVAIRRLTDRDFGAPAVTSTRTYEYRGGGVVDIDDCSSISAVVLDGRTLVDGIDYRAQRERSGGPYFYLDIYVAALDGTSSPEMGFTRNEDTYSGPRATRRNSTITVTGEFGWNPVPEDVKLAAIEMIRTVADLPKDDLQSESMSEYSYSNVVDPYRPHDWPPRAVELLRPYRRINV